MSHRSAIHPPLRRGQSLLCATAMLVLLGTVTPASAEWRWRDEKNQVHVSDRPPPPSVPESAILKRPPGAARQATTPQFASAPSSGASEPSLAASGPAKTTDPALEARRKKALEEEAAKRKAEEAKANTERAENCSRARSNLRTLEDGMRIARVNAKGEREYLDDKARAEEARRAREVVAADCK